MSRTFANKPFHVIIPPYTQRADFQAGESDFIHLLELSYCVTQILIYFNVSKQESFSKKLYL